jgi:hypothetical protein
MKGHMQINLQTILAALLCTAFASGCGGGAQDSSRSQKNGIEKVRNMPAGFQIIGDHGAVQVDENFVNLGLTAKGSVSMPASAGLLAQATITVTGDTPILCIRPLSTYASIYSVTKSGNQFTYTLVGGFTGSAAAAETFDWYVFDKMPAGTAGSVGIEVRDANGTTTFNSNFTPMIVSAIGTIPTAGMPGNPASVDTGVARTYAACLSEGRIAAAPNGNGVNGFIYWEIVKVTATGAMTSYGPAQSIPPDVSFNSGGGGQILLVDVTGL